MDLNDPRRRLQMARTTNPSLRMAAAPQQKIQLSVAKPQQISIAQPVQPQQRLSVVGAPAPQPQETRFDPFLKTISDFTQGANEQFLGGIIKAPATLANLIGSGFDQKEAERRTNEFLDTIGQTNRNGIFNSGLVGTDRNSDAFKAGEVVGRGEKLATDIATAIIPGVAAEKAISAGLAGKGIMQGAGLLPKFGRNIIPAVGGGVVSSGISQAQDPTQDAGLNVAGGAAIDTALSAIGPAGSTISRGLKGPISGFIKKLFGASKGGLVNDIASATDPATIQKALNVPEDVASYLASEPNRDNIKAVLQELSVDPNINIPDEIRERLQKEGISAIRQKDTEYGAEYDPNDASINVRDQAAATEDNLYHELGHHIYTTKLSPEERALFAKVNGPGRKQAVGREGYSEDDLISEDFSDMVRTALKGDIEKIPAALRPVIQKYAGEVEQSVQAVKTLPEEDLAAIKEAGGEVPQALSGVEAPNINPGMVDDVITPRPEAAPETKLPEEDVAAIQEAGGTLPEQVTAEAEAVGKAQTGTSETTLPPEDIAAIKEAGGAVNETKAAEKGIKFRDPATKKQIIRKVEDVQDELAKLKGLPEDKVDAKVTARIKNLEKKIYNYKSSDAKFAFPDATPDVQKEIQRVMDELRGAERRYNVAEKAKTKEKGQRIAQAGNNFEAAGGGEAGFQAKLGALKGQYDKSTFEPIKADEKTQATILNDIENSNLRDFEKLNTQNAMRKIWGANESKPTKSDINYIRKYFGDDMADAVDEAVEEGGKSWRERLVDIAGLPRAAMASFDFSMGLRQGGQVAVRHFPTWVRANKESAKYAANPKYFDKAMKEMADDDHYETIVDQMNVRLPAVQGASDEIMASAHILEKIPVYGKGIEASDRAYSGGLSKLRFDLAKQWIDNLGGIDEVTKNLSKKELQDLGEVINTSTGSGGMKGGFTEKHMETLATTLFAPRLWASRLNSINPRYYQRLSPEARKMAVQNMASFLAAATSVVALAKAAGAEVEGDPRSSDFMKIKLGNTRMDIFGGLQQNIVFVARMITGEKKNSTNGEMATLGEGFGAPDRVDLGIDMLTNKLNPLLGYLSRVLRSSDDPDSDNPVERLDRFGEKQNAAGEAANLAIPLGVQGFVDTLNETGGDVGKSAALNVPSFFGVGVQTYGESKNGTTGETKSTGDRVKDAQAKAEKIRADAKEARETAVSKLSENDRVIYEIGKADKSALDDKELAKYEKIKKWVGDYGQGQDVPEGVTSHLATAVYKKYNSMVETDQKAWLKQKPDQSSKTITSLLNKERAKGLDEFKPSNELAKLYADYEKDINTKEYSEVEKGKRAKDFQKAAYKLNFSDAAKEYYSIASSGINTLRAAIDAGKVTQRDLDAAIKLDNDLFNSGLNGSLQFSKKFRNEYGYGVPAGIAGSRSGGRGGSSSGSSGSKRAQLASLLPSASTGRASAMPKFSRKRRTAGISFKNVNTPSKTNTKKVTINL